MRTKRNGFYMVVTEEDRKNLDILKDKYAVNISQAFRLFVKDMIKKIEGKNEQR